MTKYSTINEGAVTKLEGLVVKISKQNDWLYEDVVTKVIMELCNIPSLLRNSPVFIAYGNELRLASSMPEYHNDQVTRIHFMTIGGHITWTHQKLIKR